MTPVYFVALLAFSLHTTTDAATECFECHYTNEPGGDVTQKLANTFSVINFQENLQNSPSSTYCGDQANLAPGDRSKSVSCEGACFKFKFIQGVTQWVARGCMHVPADEKCDKQSPGNSEVWSCFCTGDYCNGASSHRFTLAAALWTVLSTALLL
ncbi:PREDICTED: uncharacterized protein LOC106804828 isoform X2 [Priapulus caudatus]|uniref:Uncharacterized protein LOC106804828 isoform X2 n=1 Tax=Priapulus caudatus TaxID=37621 RepID=A0ABM1DNZ3_PRICU|nr:PREDICTED: uncharacterized protein LOC106804828 isoform X2 [Priapulus caudatus]